MTIRSILITGASSGIGAALAQHYAADGVTLFLGGRNEARLGMVAQKCRDKGATVYVDSIDVTDRAAMEEWIAGADDSRSLDLVIANAGISAGASGLYTAEDSKLFRRIFDVNWGGILNTVEPIMPRMIERGRGQIALMSSLAGFSGWPGAVAYSASKGVVRLYGEGLRGALMRRGVKVNVICPGFIKTPLTDVNPFPMPFLMTAERGAQIIARALARNKGRIAFPWPMYLLSGFIGLLPYTLMQRLLAHAPQKPDAPLDDI